MRAAWMLILALLVAGCGATGQQVASQPSTTSTTPSAAVAQRYQTVTALRDAAVAWGFNCPDWVQDNVVAVAAESGHCSESDVFSTYATDADLAEVLDNLRALPGGQTLLVGPNWIINASGPDVARLAVKLGGTVES